MVSKNNPVFLWRYNVFIYLPVTFLPVSYHQLMEGFPPLAFIQPFSGKWGIFIKVPEKPQEVTDKLASPKMDIRA